METLLRYGANVNTSFGQDNEELLSPHFPAAATTAASPILSCAAKNGVPGIVSALLRAGLDPNGRDRDGWAPLHDGKIRTSFFFSGFVSSSLAAISFKSGSNRLTRNN